MSAAAAAHPLPGQPSTGAPPHLPASGSDGALVQAAIECARDGDIGAVHLLYVRYVDLVFAFASSLVRDEFEAEEIATRLFGSLTAIVTRYDDGGEVPFADWLLSQVRELALHRVAGETLIAWECMGSLA